LSYNEISNEADEFFGTIIGRITRCFTKCMGKSLDLLLFTDFLFQIETIIRYD
jgi:hypothetical protein